MHRLTATDATHVLAESGSHVSRIIDGYVFDPAGATVDRDTVLEWLTPRIEHSPVFRSVIRRVPGDLEYPYWAPATDFDLRDHVTVEPARAPGWLAVRDRIVETCTTRLPAGKPPWELLVVTGITGVDRFPDGACVVVLKMHHGVGDGMATVEFARELFAAQPLPARDGYRPVGTAGALTRALVRIPGNLVRFARGSVRAQVLGRAAARAAATGEIRTPQFRWPTTRFNRRHGGGISFDVVTLDLAEIRSLRSRHPGVAVTDVVVAVIGDAMVSYLREHGEIPNGSLGGKVSYSMRGSLDSAGTAVTAAHAGDATSGNNFVVLTVDLNTDTEDPVARLRAIHESMAAEKRRFSNPAVAELAEALDYAPAVYVDWLVWRRSRLPIGEGETVALGNTMVSNVPRKADDMRFLGGRAIESFGILGVADGTRLNHFVASVGDRLTITFAVDPDVMPDPERYAEALRRAFETVVDAHRARVEDGVGATEEGLGVVEEA
jgi:diacylglycerol O-acyltransferase / wax synthase